MRLFIGILLASAMTNTTVGARVAAQYVDLNAKVSIEYRAARAQDVFRVLARAGSLKLEVTEEELLPVTVTLTNARLRTALDAVCENAGCQWWVDGSPAVLKVQPVAAPAGLELQSELSIHLADVAIQQALRTVASHLNVTLVLHGQLEKKNIWLSVERGPIHTVLDMLCRQSCTWNLDTQRRQLVVVVK